MTTATRAIIAVTLIGTTIVLAAQGDRIGRMLGYGALTLIAVAQHMERCSPSEPTIYLAGTRMAVCPSGQR